MSVRALTHVWEKSKQKGASLLVLLAIADSANDDGFCWLGMAKLSKKVRQTPNNTRWYIQKIESDGELIVYERKHDDDPKLNHSNLYKVVMPGASTETPPDLKGIINRRTAKTPRPRKNGGTSKNDSTPLSKLSPPPYQNQGSDPLLDPSLDPEQRETRPRFKCWVQHGERYADGVLIDVTAPDFETACNAIFHAWLDVLTEFRARPDTELDDLWSKHRPAVVALAKNRRAPEQVAAFMRDAYNDPKDDFWRNPLKLIPVMAISNGFSAWLAQSTPKPAAPPAQPAGQQSTPDLTGHNQILEALKRKAANNGAES